MRKTLHKSTTSQISLCTDFSKIWAQQGSYPKFHQSRLMRLNRTRCHHCMLLLCIKSKRSLLLVERFSTYYLVEVTASASPISPLKTGKLQCSADQILLRTLPIDFLLILSF